MADESRTSGSIQTLKNNVLFPRNRQNLKLQDQVNAPKLGKSTGKYPKGQSRNAFCSPRSNILTDDRTQRQGERDQELVKYMSRVPSYLQLLEKNDTSQTKALNMGVIDWGHLQKWNDSHKVAANEDVDAPGRCVLTSEITGSSSVSLKRASSAVRHLHEPYRREDYVEVGSKKTSRPFSSFLNMDATLHSVEQPGPSTGSSESNSQIELERHKVKVTNSSFSTSGSGSNLQEIDIFCPASSILEFTETLHTNNPELCNSESPNNGSKKIIHDRSFGTLHGTPDYVKNGQDINGTQTIEDVKTWSDGLSCGSAGSENPSAAIDYADFSGLFLSEDLHYTAKYSDVPHSCPFPLSCRDIELLEGSEPQKKNSRSNPPALTDSKCSRLHASDKTSGSDCNQDNRHMGDTLFNDHLVEAVMLKSRKMLPADPCPMRIGISWPKELPKTKQLNLGEHLEVSKVTCHTCSKGQRSPLRKMLDSLLKSSMSNQKRPGTVMASPASIIRRLSFTGKVTPREDKQVRKSLDVSPEIHAGIAMSSGQVSNCLGNESLEQSHETSEKKRQALLRLAWKDQLPVFTFSMNDSDVLVAAERRVTFPNKYDSQFCYDIYNILEVKRSIGGWINQGSKQKDFISRAVGKMLCSCHLCLGPDGLENSSALERRFVLIGSELRPTALPKPLFAQECELAAFVIRLPESTADDTAPDAQKTTVPIESCHTILSADEDSGGLLTATNEERVDVSFSDTIAILPSEVHGSSSTAGEPSPLIERWKSGGHCDCGGWDVGCSLTILAGNLHECQSKSDGQPDSVANHKHRAKLFVEGASRGSTPVFHLTQLNQGLYEVEFEPFIATLQAFSLCVAVLLCQRPESPPQAPNFLQQVDAQNNHRKTAAGAHMEAPTSYVPHRPPLSPVGRA